MTRIQRVFLAFLACCLLITTAILLTKTTFAQMEPALIETRYSKTFARIGKLEQLISRISEDGQVYAGGVYAPGTFAFPIINQPEDDNLYVSIKRDLVTLFSAATANGVTGLLAHNFLAGAYFYDLEIGQEIWLVEDKDQMHGYQITDIHQYQRVDREDGDLFIDLESRISLDASEIFDRYYIGEPHLTLQTCLENEGDPSWGLTFIIAEPIPASN